MDDDVETTNLSQTEFSLLNTCSVNLFPDPNSLSEKARKPKVIHTHWVLPALRALSTAA